MLQAFVIALFVIPSDTVIKPVGAVGYPASLIGVFVFGVYFVSLLFGLHKPVPHPIRGVLCVIWVALLAGYIAMDRGRLTGIEIASADRMLIRFMVVTGVALVAAECLRSVDDIMRVIRALVWAAGFCGFVAVLQYWLSLDLAQYLRQIPGFSPNHDNPAILARGGVNRVAGTALHAIELGVASGMMIPLAVLVGLYDRHKTKFKRWAPLTLIVLGVATSVSRSAILSVIVAFCTLVVLLPPRLRLAALAALPVAVGGIFMSAHGLIGTLLGFFSGAGSDPSIRYRTHDYPLAEELWQAKPIFGRGPGTWIPADSLNIFDNQWLGTVVELGTVGVLAFLVLYLVPPIVAIATRRMSNDPDIRLICAALAASTMPTVITSFTFDSLSFPLFVNLIAIDIGLIGACWRLTTAEPEPATATTRTPPVTPTRLELSTSPGIWPGRASS
jgi:O-antigen ligase